MDTEHHKKAVSVLRAAAMIPQTVHFSCRKRASAPPVERHVEPYALSQIENTLMLRAFQLAPDKGWRFFAVDRMAGIRSGENFLPREMITLPRDSDHAYDKPVKDGLSGYRDLILATLADMNVEPDEAKLIADYRREQKISPVQMRGVHYHVFADTLNAIIRDEIVDDEELRLINQVNACLKLCGAGTFD